MASLYRSLPISEGTRAWPSEAYLSSAAMRVLSHEAIEAAPMMAFAGSSSRKIHAGIRFRIRAGTAVRSCEPVRMHLPSRYVVGRELGRGGMGIVYEAEDNAPGPQGRHQGPSRRPGESRTKAPLRAGSARGFGTESSEHHHHPRHRHRRRRRLHRDGARRRRASEPSLP